MSSPMQDSSSGPGVALLFEDADLGAHLRKALVDAGARIVHEGPAATVTRQDLSVDKAQVVVINLDAKAEHHLDALYEILDEDSQRVVFNDAEVSSGLSGWDQARWARHLAAKLMDGHDYDPPRPEQARGIEIREPGLDLPEASMAPAPAPSTEAVTEHIPDPEPASAEEKGLSEEDNADLTAELEALLAEDGDLLERTSERSDPAQDKMDLHAVDIQFDESEMPEPDIGPELDAPDTESGQASTDNQAAADASGSRTPDVDEHSANELSLEDMLASVDEQIESHDKTHSAPDTLTDAMDSPAEDDAPAPASDDTDTGANDMELGLDDIPELSDLEIAAPEDSSDALSEVPEATDTQAKSTSAPDDSRDQGIRFTLEDPDAERPVSESAQQEESVKVPAAPDWGLVDFDAEPSASDVRAETAEPETEHPSTYGIEKVSAAEYLAPESEGETTDVEPHLSLELEPIEQAVAPKMAESSGYEMSLEGSAGTNIQRVVVLGAGAGEEARDSLLAFIGALHKAPDTAVLGVVHQNGDDLAELARHLDAAGPLDVRVAENPARVRHGEMLLIPSGKQATLGHNGRAQLLDVAEQSMGNPSIDLTLTQVAQEMGDDVLAIILAGDAIDALAGAQAVVDRGGRIWALDPADCSDNTMVTVICEEQLAQFTGTPQTLAARLLEDLS